VPYALSATDTFLDSRLHYKVMLTSWQQVSIIGLFFCFMHRCYYTCAGGTEKQLNCDQVLAAHNNISVIGQTS